MSYRSLLLAASFGLCLSANAAKTPNITTSGTISLPMVVETPEIQDLTTTDIVVNKTIFDDFTPVYTTLNLDLTQDYRGKLVGKVHFNALTDEGDSTSTEQLTITSVTGKAKSGKTGPGFSASASTSISLQTYKVTVTGVMLRQDFIPAAGPDELATAFYNVTVKISGLSRKYNYTLDHVPVKGNFRFAYAYPTPEELPRKLNPAKYEFFKVSAPWGQGLVQGTFHIIGADAVFSLKGPKFAYSGTDFGFDGINFVPNTLYVKTGMGATPKP